MIVFGISKQFGETPSDVIEKLLHLFNNQMRISVDASGIEQAQRFGKRDTDHKAVFCVFKSFKKKMEILSRARRLKGTGFAVVDDYPKEIIAKRRKMYAPLRYYREKGRYAVLRYDTLYVEGMPYQFYNGTYIRNMKYRHKVVEKYAKYNKSIHAAQYARKVQPNNDDDYGCW